MTTPDISLFSIRSWDTLRAFLYVAVPVVLLALVHTHTDLWIGLALAVLAPALSAVKSVNGFRTWFYGVIAAVQLVLLGLDLFTSAQISPWVAVIAAVVGGAPAAANVHANG